jgi:hypothetical protein
VGILAILYGLEEAICNMNTKILKPAAMSALGTALYIAVVVTVIFNLPKSFDQEPNVFIPMAMLMLFVLSAGITGFLMVGRPVMWYIDGKKKEAVQLFGASVGILFVLMLIPFFILLQRT